MTERELLVVDAMRRRGGSFVASLAEAFAHADPINFARLRASFGDYWDQYERDIRPRVVCLCGSTRFIDTFLSEAWRLTLEGAIVLSIGVVKHGPPDHAGEALGEDVAERLDVLHLRKIDMADEVRILNVGGYIGSSTHRELAYASSIGKPLSFLETGAGGPMELTP